MSKIIWSEKLRHFEDENGEPVIYAEPWADVADVCVCGMATSYVEDALNYHERLVEALREAVEIIEDQYDTIWGMAGYGKKPPCKDSDKARALLATLEAEKGGEL